MTNLNMSRAIVFLYLAIFLVMELPVRLIIQPDPWLLSAQHWYFDQPLRLIIEIALALILIITIAKTNFSLLKFRKQHTILLVTGMLVSVTLFAILEFEQLIASLDAKFPFIIMWLLSGFAIGVGQEFLYRGLLFTSLNQYLSTNVAGIVTTVAFVIAPLHSERLWEYVQQGQITVVLILIGVYVGVSTFFQWLRNHTESVTIPALVHGTGNAITWFAVFA